MSQYDKNFKEFLSIFLSKIIDEQIVKKILDDKETYQLFKDAFTTKKYSQIHGLGEENYEKLEILGDVQWDAVLMEYIFGKYGNNLKSEGQISDLKNHFKNNRFFTRISKALGFAEHIRKAQIDEGKTYANVFEAHIAAIKKSVDKYVKNGGYVAINALIEYIFNNPENWKGIIIDNSNIEEIVKIYTDNPYYYKSRFTILKEYYDRKGEKLVLEKTEPDKDGFINVVIKTGKGKVLGKSKALDKGSGAEDVAEKILKDIYKGKDFIDEYRKIKEPKYGLAWADLSRVYDIPDKFYELDLDIKFDENKGYQSVPVYITPNGIIPFDKTMKFNYYKSKEDSITSTITLLKLKQPIYIKK